MLWCAAFQKLRGTAEEFAKDLPPVAAGLFFAARKITKVLQCCHSALQMERLWRILVRSCLKVGPALKICLQGLQFSWSLVEAVRGEG